MKTSGIRAELREFKRERILEEVLDLFYERGFHGTTLDALAERLEVTKPFIYQFFRSKEELLIAIQQRGAEQILGFVDEVLHKEGPPAERLHYFAYKFAKQNIDAQAISAIFLQEERSFSKESLRMIRKKYREFDDNLEKLIMVGIKTGDFQVEDARMAALAIAGMVRWIHRWYQPGGRLSGREVAAMFADFALKLVSYQGPPLTPPAD